MLALLLGQLSFTVRAAELSTTQRLELLERRVNQVTNLTLELDQVRAENRQLRGEIESLGHEIDQLKRKQRDIYLDIDQRLGALKGSGAGGVSPPAPASGGGAVEAPADTRSVPPASAASADRDKIEAEYDAAKALLSPQQKRYAEAAKGFETFLAKYPNDPLAANAQYWLGEAHYVTQDNAAAQKAFEAVVSVYPDSNKVPDALYKIGRIRQAAGDAVGARSSYETLVANHPGTAAAGLAQHVLDQLRR